ncbi:bestrophin family protein [Pseudomonas putida]|jgi:putative membrane protein|uniref:Bestrophin n=1 Tax=Pseudomonas putida (strain ATCC 700007 / DSM 6899 / JCM 31910 / BCRC 17059 / LMG 24140 / F1) TaxID=351746 RepID=A5VZZ1_PSEP1|nr:MULTISPECIES: bestrophin family protein [Pseudomonas]MDD1999975.1 bestrophin family protein [Pseudomonas putida]MEB3440378.1 bestrophin family protein [Pseudomonas sp. A2]HDS1789333.1 bestrophin family protein [Pseudomonas putida]
MIVPPSTDVLRVLFTLKGSIVKRIALRCLMVTLLAALIVLVERHFPTYFYPVSATPFTLLGLSLSIFMSFRNNACYDRWWEGRKAWGKLIIETRSFVRESVAITDETLRAELLRNLCGFAHALNARLRNEDERAAARPWLARADAISPHNVCDGILREIGEHCSRLAAQQQISEWRYTLLEQRLVGLTEVQATCERIKGTPLPFPYTLLLHRTIYIFCLLLPFALAEPLGWLAPLFTTIVGYTFFGLDAIGNELEDPFGRDENDLPTDAMVRTVERDVLAGLGERQLPPALLPVGYVLS